MIAPTILLLFGGGLAWRVFAVMHQDRLNRALIAAVKKSDTRAVLSLLDHGANPNARDEPDKHLSLWQRLLSWFPGRRHPASFAPTALALAVEPPPIPISSSVSDIPDENPAIIQALVNKGADVSAKDVDGSPIVIYPIEHDYDQTAQLLFEHGADVNATDKDGNTPLIAAAAGGKPRLIQLLLDRGANINAESRIGQRSGRTALLWLICNHAGGAQKQPIQALKLLIAHGADVNRCEKDEAGKTMFKTMFEELKYYNSLDLAPILKAAGAKE